MTLREAPLAPFRAVQRNQDAVLGDWLYLKYFLGNGHLPIVPP